MVQSCLKYSETFQHRHYPPRYFLRVKALSLVLRRGPLKRSRTKLVHPGEVPTRRLLEQESVLHHWAVHLLALMLKRTGLFLPRYTTLLYFVARPFQDQ